MRIEMPYEAEWIIDNIRSHGYEAFIVGGCVRDAVLGRIPGDWDITTSAKPEQVKEIFGKTVDTGLKHGTVTIIKHGSGYEVTTYRIDGEYLDGRHPETVEFTPDLREDLKRRDFTINAMAYSHETGIVDEFEGMEDLKRRVIRCVGCAKDRFTEDALRILRAVRFAAQLDFVIEDETYKAIAEIAPNLVHVSKERIQVELTKLLLSDHPEKIWMVDATGIADYVTSGFPEVFERELERENSHNAGENETPGTSGCLVDGASRDALKECWIGLAALPADKSHRWAGFLRHMTAEQAVKILRGLKLDNDTIGNVKNMIMAFQAPLAVDKVEIRRLLSRVTEYQFLGAMQLKKLDGDETVPGILRLFEEIKEAGDCVSLKQLAVNGGDLLAKGLEKGKQIGDGLMYLLNLVLEKPELNKKDILLEKINQFKEK
ncbi:polynucleotide adenylyltransferase [Lachnospiraceae bacterium CLA-AA-H58]|uniref:CCA tRNA nucleotidyltransferase n=1 Tax=Clostridiaceae TaxID=31979 RepID=UPI001C030AA6|nr:polynucleotide adenylyltransferase [Clostridium sp. MCC328]